MTSFALNNLSNVLYAQNVSLFDTFFVYEHMQDFITAL